MKVSRIFILVTAFMFFACGGGKEVSTNQQPQPTPDPAPTPTPTPTPTPSRPSNTSCLAGAPVSYAGIRVTNAFPNLTFTQPLAMITAPSGSMVYVVERGGTIRAFNNDPSVTTTTEFANISSKISTNGEGGLLGMAFDPNFSMNGYVYLSYTESDGAGSLISRISRFQTNATRTAILSATEENLLTLHQPFANHNGGQIAFGPNNYLFIGFGDGGSANDPNHNGQDTTTYFGTILRIDPSAPDTVRGLPYSIPAGNPFSGNNSCADGGCPEIYAWGFRNPWRWSFDRNTNQLWVGDVGQVTREEIDLVEPGKNYGWGCYEGTRFNTDYTGSCPNDLVHEPPVYEYVNGSFGNSVTGGYVYHGSNIPSLVGSYVFTDYGSGTIWALTNPYSNPQLTTLVTGYNYISSMAEDANGELYTINIAAGEIDRLEPDTGSATAQPFASQLSQTGCADSSNPKLGTSGMIPYEINARLWSDSATKKRWMALPDNTTIDIDADADWHFPVGSVLRKDFYLGNQIVETRLFAHHTDGSWAGYSYEWNATQTDATLLDAGKTVNVNGQNWTYPSQAQCLQCHTSAAGRTLGPETAQLNRLITDPSNSMNQINQITLLDTIGMFTSSPGDPASLPALTPYDDITAQPVDLARSYLHSNCSHCHRAGGPVSSNMDLRYNISVANMNLCDALPAYGNVLGATHLFTPNNISDSILYQRMRELAGSTRMPPIGTAMEDPQGLQFISNWINSIATCP